MPMQKKVVFKRYRGRLTMNCEAVDDIDALLGTEGLGTFMKFVAAYVRSGPIPDHASSASLGGRTVGEWHETRPLLLEMFEKREDGLWHRDDLDLVIASTSAASERGRKAVNARWARYRTSNGDSSSARKQPRHEETLSSARKQPAKRKAAAE